MTHGDKQERFFKHRRNLLLLSCVFIFVVLTKTKIDSLNILGSRLSFDDPSVAVKLLLISIIYMVIKYFQFLFELGGTGIKSKVFQYIVMVVPRVAKKNRDKIYGSDAGFKESDYTVMGRIGFFSYQVLEDISSHVEDEKTHGIAKAMSDKYIIDLKLLWSYYLREYIHVILTTTWAAEFVMPILLAFVGVGLYFGYGGWLITFINGMADPKTWVLGS